MGTLAACSLAVCGLRTRPRTDVDPPRVELPPVGAYRLAAPGLVNLLVTMLIGYRAACSGSSIGLVLYVAVMRALQLMSAVQFVCCERGLMAFFSLARRDVISPVEHSLLR